MPLDVAVAGGLNGTSVAARLRVARKRVPGAWDTFGEAAPTAAATPPWPRSAGGATPALARRYDLPISQVANAARPVRGVAARARWEPGRPGTAAPRLPLREFQDRAHLDRAVVGAWDFGGRDPQERLPAPHDTALGDLAVLTQHDERATPRSTATRAAGRLRVAGAPATRGRPSADLAGRCGAGGSGGGQREVLSAYALIQTEVGKAAQVVHAN